MKNYCWIVEVQNPINLEENVWYYAGETLEKVCNKWRDETGNNFLNYHKLHNIYHNRNKGDTTLIKVKKIKQNIATIEVANTTT